MVFEPRFPFGEYQAVRVQAPPFRFFAKILRCLRPMPGKPENAALNLAENPNPTIEHGWKYFSRIIETAKYESLAWQTGSASGHSHVGDSALRIIGLIAAQADNLLCELAMIHLSNDRIVGNQIVQHAISHCPGVAKVAYLDWRHTHHKYARTAASRKAAEIDGDIEFASPRLLDNLLVTKLADLDKLIEREFDTLPHLVPHRRPEDKGGQFEPRPVMRLE
jgi:hypothetical protein